MQTFTGMEYVKIDIANQFGLDKLTWAERIQWTDDHETRLEAMDTQADEPILYRKAVRAYRTAQQGKPTNHIMGLDATASGVQMMAAMSQCKRSARTVNLINTGAREDLYTMVVNDMNSNHGFTLTRDDLKKPIMTFFYGSEAVPEAIFGKDTPALKGFYQTMSNVLRGPYALMQLFQSHWNPTAEEYSWVMPDKHVVHVPVVVTQEKGIEIDEADHFRYTMRAKVQMPKEKGRALAANIVHSIDGWVCREMVKRAKQQGFWMTPIHDCFFAHPNKMNQVRQNYLDIMCQIAQMDLVPYILNQINPYSRLLGTYKFGRGLEKDISNAEYALS